MGLLQSSGGPIYYDTSTNQLKVWSGSNWSNVVSANTTWQTVPVTNESDEKLGQIAAVLGDSDPDPMRSPRVYLASKFEDYERQKRLRDYLWEKHAILVTARWIRGGHDPNGNTPDEALKYATEDLADLRAADMIVVWNPKSFHGSGRGGRHVELGYAIACGKPIILVGPPENVFYYLPDIIELPDPESGAVIASNDPNVKGGAVDEAFCFELIAQTIKANFTKTT